MENMVPDKRLSISRLMFTQSMSIYIRIQFLPHREHGLYILKCFLGKYSLFNAKNVWHHIV